LNFKVIPFGHPQVGVVILFPEQDKQFVEVPEHVAHYALQAAHEAAPES
jgi:hypothetical protein